MLKGVGVVGGSGKVLKEWLVNFSFFNFFIFFFYLSTILVYNQ